MMRLLFLGVALRLLLALANAQIEEWTCPDCGTSQESGRARCMNGCGTNGPLAVPDEDS